MRKHTFIKTAICVFLLSCALPVCAQDISDLNQYDKQWVKRNPLTRLDIVTRAIMHYRRGVGLLEQRNLDEAEVAFSDALKVVPEFAEAHRMLARLYQQKGNQRNVEKYMKKYEKYSKDISVLDEFEYLQANKERLAQSYKPSRIIDRIMLYFLFIVGVSVVGYFIFMSDLSSSVTMNVKRMQRQREISKADKSDIIIDAFPGEEKEERVPVVLKIILYLLPFALFFVISKFFGAGKKEVIMFTVFPGILVDVIMAKIFFGDDDDSPRGFGGMGRGMGRM